MSLAGSFHINRYVFVWFLPKYFVKTFLLDIFKFYVCINSYFSHILFTKLAKEFCILFILFSLGKLTNGGKIYT